MAVVLGVVKTHWAGTSGGPGYTQMAFQSQVDPHTWDDAAAQTAANAVHQFWDTIKDVLPDNIALTVDPVVDIFNIIDAGLVGTYSAASAPAAVHGTNVGQFSMAAGFKVTLKTGSVIRRRRVHGGIFVVPAAGQAFDSDGVITSTANASLLSASNTLRTTMLAANAGLCVWSRPKKAKAPHPAYDGAASDVTGFTVNQHGATLRGRRD